MRCLTIVVVALVADENVTKLVYVGSLSLGAISPRLSTYVELGKAIWIANNVYIIRWIPNVRTVIWNL